MIQVDGTSIELEFLWHAFSEAAIWSWWGGCRAADFIIAWRFVQLKKRRGTSWGEKGGIFTHYDNVSFQIGPSFIFPKAENDLRMF